MGARVSRSVSITENETQTFIPDEYQSLSPMVFHTPCKNSVDMRLSVDNYRRKVRDDHPEYAYKRVPTSVD